MEKFNVIGSKKVKIVDAITQTRNEIQILITVDSFNN